MTSYGVSNYAMPNLMPCIVIGFEGINSLTMLGMNRDVLVIDVSGATPTEFRFTRGWVNGRALCR